MDYSKYSKDSLNKQLDLVIELKDLVQNGRRFVEAVEDEEFLMLIKMQELLFKELRNK